MKTLFFSTPFFRDKVQFDFFSKHILKSLQERNFRFGQRNIFVWSAACSSGEEPYTIAICLKEALKSFLSWNVKILASDISTKVLRRAQDGIYHSESIESLNSKDIKPYFFKQKGEKDEIFYQIKPELRELITFRRFNLNQDKFSFSRGFDAIFCKNVMIYFNQETRQHILDKMHNSLVKGGYLFLGSSENMVGIEHLFEMVRPGIFQRPLDEKH